MSDQIEIPENPGSDDPAVVAVQKLNIGAGAAIASGAGPVFNKKLMLELGELGMQVENFGLAKIAGGALICSMQGAVEIAQELVAIVKCDKVAYKTKIAAAFAHAAVTKSVQGCATAVNASGIANVQQKKRKVVFGVPRIIPKAIAVAAG